MTGRTCSIAFYTVAAMASDQLELARLALCTMMYGNLGVLMDKYRETPLVVENFWQLDLIRRTGQGGGDDDLPNTQVNISGKITDAGLGTPLANVEVTLFPTTSGPGASDPSTFTDADGNYNFSFDDVPTASDVTLVAKLPGYLNTSLQLNVTPGNDYPNNDMSMAPNP